MAEDEGLLMARITIERHLMPNEDIVDSVTTEDSNGDDLPLTEGLGMLRLAEDTLIRDTMEER